ncbi:AAA family ATPase [uncultured Jannaschia sp.]|uniref:AAA family ATPase n=1 Tax=uncultured Jannaschia sp. TaxID=293347 RepID=UPI0026364A84|nr:AAA family ATPase [uncultured Jannaschia sp.]
MPRIPIVAARFAEVPSVTDIERRLYAHLAQLRGQRTGNNPGMPSDGDEDIHLWQLCLPRSDKIRIHRRARALHDRAEAATGLAHLSAATRARLAVLRDGADLVGIPTEHRADEIAAALHADMPWMAPATETVWHAMRRSVREGDPGLRLPSLLLVGPPGIGKSHWARTLGSLVGAPTTIVDATSEPAGFAIVGSQVGWASAGPGRVLEMILAHRVANPLIVIDEIEKAGSVGSKSGTAHDLAQALLPLLDRSTAAAWSCPYFRVRFDMCWIGWVLTANTTEGLSAPLLSRCPALHLSGPTRQHLQDFAVRQACTHGLPDEATAAILSLLERTPDGAALSLRTIQRCVSRAKAALAMPMLH